MPYGKSKFMNAQAINDNGRHVVRLTYENGRIFEVGRLVTLTPEHAQAMANELNATMNRREFQHVQITAIPVPLDKLLGSAVYDAALQNEQVIAARALDLYHYANALVLSKFADGNARAVLTSIVDEINAAARIGGTSND